MQSLHLRPQLRLGFSDERAHLRRIESFLLVLFSVGARPPTAVGQQNFLHVGFKSVFVGLAHA